MIKPEKFFLLTALIGILLFLMPAGAIVVFDPFFVYHKPLFIKDPGFINSDRYQASGFINTYLSDPKSPYDKVIIGTSLSQNFELDDYTIPLTLAGGRAKELAAIAEKTLASGKVKSVIWEIFISYSDQNPDDVHPDAPLPLWLYDDVLLNDWRYLFNGSVAKQAVKLIRGKTKHRKPIKNLYHWTQIEAEMFENFQAPDNIEKLRRTVRRKNLSFTLTPPHELRALRFPSVEKNLLPYLKENPQVHFDLFFPPVSYYDHIAKRNNEGFWTEMLMRRAVLEGIKNMPHVRVFAFDLIDGICDDITIYRDSEHYPAWVNKKIWESIENGEHRITLTDWPSYSRMMAGRINDFSARFAFPANYSHSD